MYEQFKELADVDITTGPMEVGPTTHYVMGGIRVDAETGATTVAGPVRAPARWPAGMHGANRLGGNSLSDLLVFGARTGAAAAAHAAADDARAVRGPDPGRGGGRRRWTRRSSGPTGEDPYAIQRDLQDMMQRLVGIFRVEADLDEALRRLGELRARLAERPGRPAAGPTTRAGTSSSSSTTC